MFNVSSCIVLIVITGQVAPRCYIRVKWVGLHCVNY